MKKKKKRCDANDRFHCTRYLKQNNHRCQRFVFFLLEVTKEGMGRRVKGNVIVVCLAVVFWKTL